MDLRSRIKHLLQTKRYFYALLGELRSLVPQEEKFSQLADLWAPVLYKRYPDLFERFLVEDLSRNPMVATSLLPNIQLKGNESLYQKLYALSEEQWNRDLLALLQSDEAEIEVVRRVEELHKSLTVWYNLNKENVLALSRRDGVYFLRLLRNHLDLLYIKSPHAITQLRQEVWQRGDEEFYWYLFREFASQEECQAALELLLKQDLPVEQIEEELRKRYRIKRQQIEPTILVKFLSKYGAVLVPFVERYANLLSPDARKRLLAAIEPLNERLFRSLYMDLVSNEEWNRDLFVLAQSDEPDNEVRRAVARREMRGGKVREYRLTDETARAVYARNPASFRAFVRRHLKEDAQSAWFRGHLQEAQYTQLRHEAWEQGDEEFYWYLFRQFATEQETEAALELLLEEEVPAERIEEALRKRLPTNRWDRDIDMSILVEFLEEYGTILVPLIEENTSRLPPYAQQHLLDLLKQLDDESYYWIFFFKISFNNILWNEALRELLERPLEGDELFIQLQYRTPPPLSPTRWHPWRLKDEIALALYRQYGERVRPFLSRFLEHATLKLFGEAERRGDEEFLDFLTWRFMPQLSDLLYRAYHSADWEEKLKAQPEVEEIGARLSARFDRLYAESPERYVRHAANVMSHARAFQLPKGKHKYNPLFAYLYHKHREAWRQSPDGIRELLDSPNLYVQVLGVDILSEGGGEAAQRVIENLPMLRACLLGGARKNIKKRVLQCLEQAAKQDPAFAKQILPILEETMDFRSKHAINERIMVSFVRLRRQIRHQTAQKVRA